MNRMQRAYDESLDILSNDLKKNMGTSKHKAKQEAREKGLPANRVGGLRSPASYERYTREAKKYIFTVGPTNPELKHISDYECMAPSYLQELVYNHYNGNGYSASTIGTIASALGKVFGCSKNSFGVILPIRSAKDFKNSRMPVKSDARYKNLAKYGDAFNMSLAVGARKGGLMKLAVGDLIQDKYGNYYVTLDEKNGKVRRSKVLPELQDKVLEIFSNPKGPVVNGKRRIFDKHDIPSGTHEWRAAYAMNLYRFYENLIKLGVIKKPKLEDKSEFYCMKKDRKGEVFDRWILIKVSFNLGHGASRESLVANNYLRKGFGLHTRACAEYNKKRKNVIPKRDRDNYETATVE